MNNQTISYPFFTDFPELVRTAIAPNGVGVNGQHTELWDRLRRAANAPIGAALPAGDWVPVHESLDAKTALRLGMEWLTTQSKDLHVCVWTTSWLLEHEHLQGAAAGLRGLLAWCETWWVAGYPCVEPGDREQSSTNAAIRQGLLDWLDRRIHALLKLSLAGRALNDVEISQGIAVHTVCGEIASWLDTHAVWLDEAHMRPQSAWFDQTRQLLASMGLDEMSMKTTACSSGHTLEATRDLDEPAGRPMVATAVPTFRHRREALDGLQSIAQYFAHHEPSGPLAPMLQRALALAEQPMEQWLLSLVEDGVTRRRLADAFGLRT